MDSVGSEDYHHSPSKGTQNHRRLRFKCLRLSRRRTVSAGMKALLLAMLLVCTLCPDTARAQTAVRLCGREFLRAVVYTCGGSRWRRVPYKTSAEDTDLDDGQLLGETERLRRDPDVALPAKCCNVGCRRHDLALMC